VKTVQRGIYRGGRSKIAVRSRSGGGEVGGGGEDTRRVNQSHCMGFKRGEGGA